MGFDLIKFFSAFIPGKRCRWAFRNRHALARLSATNDINIGDSDVGRCRLSIVGRNNVVHIGRLSGRNGVIDIRIFGDGNEVRIGDDVSVAQSMLVVIGQNHRNFGPVSGCKISIGSKTSVESASLFTYNSGAAIEIGDDCMLSYGITIYQTDGHPILNRMTGAVINRVGVLHVGDHVWIGGRTTLLKNTFIPDDCIIGFGSVVSGRFDRQHCAIAGNPAQEVTALGREITWSRGNPDYIANGFAQEGRKENVQV